MHPAIKATSLLILLASGFPIAATAKADRDARLVCYDRLGGWTFAIDTNAVWTQTEKTNVRRDPKAGDTVDLSKGLLGSYSAKINDGLRFV